MVLDSLPRQPLVRVVVVYLLVLAKGARLNAQPTRREGLRQLHAAHMQLPARLLVAHGVVEGQEVLQRFCDCSEQIFH